MVNEKCERGYCAGVFDLLHVGHVNLFQNAKEKCNYLIVGVLTDELVQHFKGHMPVIPFSERIRMVESCKYVDEAVPVTFENIGKVDAWNRCHYDLFFSGDDYSGNPTWMLEKSMLNERGADIYFFPYTKETSSTKIRTQMGEDIKNVERVDSTKETAVFTIASKNYFAYVKTLMKSLERTNPDLKRVVIVVDDIDDEFANLERNFELIDLCSLDLPDEDIMKFRYTIMEFNTAVKPFAFLKLFKRFDRVIYMDPDICVYEKMREVDEALDGGHNFVLTPHLLDFYPNDGKLPDEPYIMRSGVYNLGFLALNKADDTIKMVKWWARKLTDQCVVDLPQGIFVDQKWIDLIPGMFDSVYILRHPGYNIAYWNISHRNIEKKGNKFFVNGKPLVFFHYSGVNPDNYECVSKHQNRYTLSDLESARELFEGYVSKVKKEDFDFWKKYKYSFSTFTDGRNVTDQMRKDYRESSKLQFLCGSNPFACSELFIGKLRVAESKDSQMEHKAKMYDMVTTLSEGKSVVVYGMGAFGSRLIDELLDAKFGKIDCICDNNSNLKKYRGIAVEKHDEVVSKYPEALYIVTPKYYKEEIIANLVARGINKSNILTYDPQNEELIPVEVRFEELKNGVNLVGYLRSEHGIGEAGRLCANCLNNTEVEWEGFDFEFGNTIRQQDFSLNDVITNRINNNISLMVVNADQLIAKRNMFPREIQNTYKIGMWYWELPVFPERWIEAFDMVDEIWAPTKFIKECLEKKARCPVIHMPPGLYREQPSAEFNRKYFGLPRGAFLYLNMFDINSYEMRKNPVASIRAFQKAFAHDDMSVGLVVKMNNYVDTPEQQQRIAELIGEYKNIYIFKKIMSREEVNALINVCDVAVSLHRSEGLGLLCEEAMFFGKPVIATGWSGNMDFMSKDNSCLVDYKMCKVGRNVGPYEAWQVWADPCIDQAAKYMTRLCDDKGYYENIAKSAEATIKNQFSPKVCGQKMQDRVKEIWAQENISVTKWGYHIDTNKWKLNIIKNIVLKMGGEVGDDYYSMALAGKQLNIEYLEQLIANTSKVVEMDNRTFIMSLYKLLLNRDCRTDELALWENGFALGTNRKDIIRTFLVSDEFTRMFEV